MMSAAEINTALHQTYTRIAIRHFGPLTIPIESNDNDPPS